MSENTTYDVTIPFVAGSHKLNLTEADNAGTQNSRECTLIITKGISAVHVAETGLEVVGRAFFGIYDIQGEIINVRNAKEEEITMNEEIHNIKTIMGLQDNEHYTNVSSLRYGRIMIMTDMNDEGTYFKGLLINFLDHFYPSLLRLPDFLIEFTTPFVTVKNKDQRMDFFSLTEYNEWLEHTPDSHEWDTKSFNGVVGENSKADAHYYFTHLEKYMLPFSTTQEKDRELIDLTFNEKRMDELNEMLRNFKPAAYLNRRVEEITFSGFIKKELFHALIAKNTSATTESSCNSQQYIRVPHNKL